MAETHSQAANTEVDAGSSYLLSFPSEPPDIRNWFSSYEYESPDSSDLHHDIGSDKDDDGETQDPSRNSGIQIEEQSPELEVLDHSYSKGRQNLLAEFKRTCNEGNEGNTKCNYPTAVTSLVEDFDQNTEKPVASLKRKQSLQHEVKERCISQGTRKEYVTDISSSGRGYRSIVEDNLRQKISNTEESAGNDSADGFISIKKREVRKGKQGSYSLSAHDENGDRGRQTTRKHLMSEDQTWKENNGVLTRKGDDHAEKGRVLADRTNIQTGEEVAGKWQCPRKNKPYIGPPLKQLRLEQWVRRVN